MVKSDCRLQIADCRLTRQGLQSTNCYRRGFTLLEVVLAISLSVVLLTALYLTLNLHYSHARAGRELTDEAAIIRAVMNRITDDIHGQLGPMNPLIYAKVNGT